LLDLLAEGDDPFKELTEERQPEPQISSKAP
jgi:hypothetical protein